MFVYANLFALPSPLRAAAQYLGWPHSATSTLCNRSFLPYKISEALYIHAQMLIFFCVSARG